jgi:hypothetical protein
MSSGRKGGTWKALGSFKTPLRRWIPRSKFQLASGAVFALYSSEYVSEPGEAATSAERTWDRKAIAFLRRMFLLAFSGG